jgi:uncharacterized protein YukE
VAGQGGAEDMIAFVRQLQGEHGAHKARLDRLKRELNEMQVQWTQSTAICFLVP